MKVLLIGASSYIGARLFHDLDSDFELLGTRFNNSISDRFVHLDLNDRMALSKLITEFKPEIIVHLANYSSSRSIAGNEDKYQKLNLEATKSLVEIANEQSCKVIFFSSMASATKTNLYGQLKAESEELIRTVKAGYFILRPSAVIGVSPNRQNNKITDKIILTIEGDPQEFDTSWLLQPTYIGHISQVIAKVLNGGHWNGDLSLYTNHPVTQYQIAKDVLIHFGMQAEPTDLGIKIPLMPDNSHALSSYNLNPVKYDAIIAKIANEIKEKDSITIYTNQ